MMSHSSLIISSTNIISSTCTMTMVTAILYIAFCFTGALAAMAQEEPTLEMPMGLDDLASMAGYGEDKLSTVLITGSVLCEETSHNINVIRARNIPRTPPQPISGALVAVDCQIGRKRRSRSSWTRGITDENGFFSIDLPSHIHATPNLHSKCSVQLLRIPKHSQCGPTYLHGRRPVQLSSIGDGVRTYSAGKIKITKPVRKTSQARVMNGQRNHGENR